MHALRSWVIQRGVMPLAAVGMLVGPAASATEDPTALKKFWESTQKFDNLLRRTDSREDVISLCDRYASLLKTMARPDAGNSRFLDDAIHREISRTNLVKAEWFESPGKFARVHLDPSWIKSGQYKEASADFRKVLGLKANHTASEFRPDLCKGFGVGSTICGKPWLCPLKEFVESVAEVKSLRANTSRVQVGMPGFPHSSFFYHSYDGDFTRKVGAAGGRFNRMYVVTDGWDQVVAVQFTCESPKAASYIKHGGIGIFNYVQFRRKGSSSAHVRYFTSSSGGTTKIHTLLVDGGGAKEINVLILPQPTLELVRFNLGQP